jgi:hypothetical protein
MPSRERVTFGSCNDIPSLGYRVTADQNLAIDRLDKRVHVALPIRVTYWDSENRPRLEMACTYDISARGARVTGLRCVKQAGEIVTVQRGLSKTFCRVVWVGEPNSELQGQVGIQAVESGQMMWGNELRDMEEVYELIQRDGSLHRLNAGSGTLAGNRRRHQRFFVQGIAELPRVEARSQTEAGLKNLSELGCLLETPQTLTPGTDLKLVLNVSNYDLSVKGKVRHSVPELGVGIEFREIRKGDRQVLRYLLRKLGELQQAAEVLQPREEILSF